MIEININELKQKLLEKYNKSGDPKVEERYLHSLSVAKKALEIIEENNFPVDKTKAEVAGLIHDYAKFATMNEYFEIVKEFDLDESILEKNFKILHALLGPYIIKKELGIDDEEILEAIKYHTTGRPKMSLLEEIIFLADFAEDTRVYPNQEEKLNQIREVIKRNYKRAIAMILDFQINHVISQKYELFELTRLAFNDYEKFLNSDEEKVDKILEKLDHNLVKDIVVYDVRNRTPLYDYVIVTTSLSPRQMDAGINYLKEAFNASRVEKGETWSLIDLRDVIVHIFNEEDRQHYGIDKLYVGLPFRSIIK